MFKPAELIICLDINLKFLIVWRMITDEESIPKYGSPHPKSNERGNAVFVLSVFSSPEPKAQVSYCHRAPSVVRPSVVRP